MTELDSLFKLDGDLDSLDKNVHQKYASPLPLPPPFKLLLTNSPLGSKPSPHKHRSSKPLKRDSVQPKTD